MDSNGETRRRSIRLQGYDYSNDGFYFITLCASERLSLFGKVIGNAESSKVVLSPIGAVLLDEWLLTPTIRPEIMLDYCVIMPNHFHAIVIISRPVRPRVAAHGSAPESPPPPDPRVAAHGSAPESPPPPDPRVAAHGSAPHNKLVRQPQSLSSLVAGFKGAVTRRARILTGNAGFQVWQRNYYEHIIRNEFDLAEKRQYIENNPLKWTLDEYYGE